MAKKEATPEEEAAPKKRGKKLLLIMLLVVLLGGGAAGYLVIGGGGKAAAAAAPKPGAVLPLGAIDVNLAGGHFLKLDMALQLTADAGAEEPDGSHALDIAIAEFSGKDMTKLAKAANREAAKAELLTKLKEAYEGKVMGVYFTQFVMQ